jgi:hypothetical protein
MWASSIQHRASCFSCGSVQRLEVEVDALEKVGLKPHWSGLSSVRLLDSLPLVSCIADPVILSLLWHDYLKPQSR